MLSELKKEYPAEWQREQRRSYLVSYYRKAFHKQYLRSKKYITDTVMRAWYYADMQEKAVQRGQFDTAFIIAGKMKECIGILKKYQDEAYFRKQAEKGEAMKDEITKDMIRRAKDYPFESLMEFKRGKAHCPFHEDETPSFGVKDNRGHCFSCGWSGDAIAFIMKRDGVSFPDAVRSLQ